MDAAGRRHGGGVAVSYIVTIPNAVTIGRLACVPAALYFMAEDRMAEAFWLFVVAAVSDAVDGFLARVLKARSVLGAWLDPAADKALLVGSYVMLAWRGDIPVWLAALVVTRDLLIVAVALRLYLVGHARHVRPLLLSKANTLMQIMLAVTVLMREAFAFADPGLVAMLIWVVAATTVGSGLAYLARLRASVGAARSGGIDA